MEAGAYVRAVAPFEEYSARRPDEMHVHLLRDDDVSVDHQLAV